MLEVTDISKLMTESITIDDYTPLKIRWGELTPRFYWRMGNIKTSLLELGIDRATHAICGLSVTLPGKVIKSSEIDISKGIQKIAGLPKCKINQEQLGNENCLDYPAPFEIHLYKTGVFLLLAASKEIKFQIVAERASFYLDKNKRLSLIAVDNLSASEMNCLTASLN